MSTIAILKVLQKFKMAAIGQLQNVLCVQKLKFHYHIPHDMEIFSRFY